MPPNDGADFGRGKTSTSNGDGPKRPDEPGSDRLVAQENSQEVGAKAEANAEDNAMTGTRVLEYLGRHPDFFVDHPDLLNRLNVPEREFGSAPNGLADGDHDGLPQSQDGAAAPTGTVIDLQQYMLDQTRARAADLEGQLSEIVGLAREGMQGSARIQAAVLELISARDLDELIGTVTENLAVTLDLDIVVLAVDGGSAERGGVPLFANGGVTVMPDGYIDTVLRDADVVLNENISGDRRLFGAAAELVRSQALLRLPVFPDEAPAMLAMGVRRTHEFEPHQGTDLMSFLGEALTLSLRTRLNMHG
jgi:uncharacterized protein YigA (DUF484 family)